VRTVWKKILVTALIVTLYRIGCLIPLPTVQPKTLQFIGTTRYSSIWQQFGGNPLSSVSIFALGVVPYVTSSLVLQLLGSVIPAIQRLQESTQGQARARRLTIATAIVVALVQAVVTVTVFKQNRAMVGVTINPGIWSAVLTAAMLVLGFLLILFLADVVTRHGIGSGITVLLLVTVLSAAASQLRRALPLARTSEILVAGVVTLVIVTLAVVGLRSYQRIRVLSNEMLLVGRRRSVELRAHILQGGVAPMVFASSLLGLVSGTASRLGGDGVARLLGGGSLASAFLFAALVAGFTRLHMRMTLDPVATANDLVGLGYFIERTPPGWLSADRLTGYGGAAAIAISGLLLPMTLLPSLTTSGTNGLSALIGASTTLLVTGVAVEILREARTGLKRTATAPLILTGGAPPDPWSSTTDPVTAN
jgi:preprotein translocase subunit SecY